MENWKVNLLEVSQKLNTEKPLETRPASLCTSCKIFCFPTTYKTKVTAATRLSVRLQYHHQATLLRVAKGALLFC